MSIKAQPASSSFTRISSGRKPYGAPIAGNVRKRRIVALFAELHVAGAVRFHLREVIDVELLIKAIEQELKAVGIDAHAAGLGVASGSPALQMLRWYRGTKDKLTEFIVVTHPADRFAYKGRMLRGPIA